MSLIKNLGRSNSDSANSIAETYMFYSHVTIVMWEVSTLSPLECPTISTSTTHCISSLSIKSHMNTCFGFILERIWCKSKQVILKELRNLPLVVVDLSTHKICMIRDYPRHQALCTDGCIHNCTRAKCLSLVLCLAE